MQQRLPITDPLIKELSFLDPEVLLSQAARSGSDGLSDLPALIGNFKDRLQLDSSALALEWRRIPSEIRGPLRVKHAKMKVEDAWTEIASLKNNKEELMFPQLTKLASVALILPHSNSDSERGFSIVTDVRTKKRNRMGREVLNAIVVTRTSFVPKSIDCTTFEVRKEHLDRHNHTMYRREK